MPAALDSIHAAAEEGDVDRLNRFLVDGETVDARDSEGRTPLMYAIHGRHADVVRHMLKWGAAVDAQTKSGATALRMAARAGDAEIVRLLLARGADPNQVVTPQPQPVSLETATKMAESMKQFHATMGGVLPGIGKNDAPKTSEELIAESQKPRESVRSGFRTLMGAIQSDSVETVTALLEAGIDREAPETERLDGTQHSGMGPLNFAIGQSSLEMVRALVAHGFAIEAREGVTDVSPLIGAVMRGKVDVARFLLESGADPDAGMMPPLQFAIAQNKVEMVELLLEYGAQTTDRENKAPTSLMARDKPEMLALLERHKGTDWHHAVKSGDVETVRARLDAGALVDAYDKPGETALYFATEDNLPEMVKLLLSRGANPNVATHIGMTPLMRAVGKSFVEVARMLIAGGAKVDAVNSWGRSALYFACGDDKRGVRELLIASGIHVGIVEAAFLGDRERVLSFLNNGTPVDTPNEGGMTALMAAAQNDDRELAALLHDVWGADVNARDAKGQTPLFFAAQAAKNEKVNAEMMRLLLDWGAEVNAESEDGSTALYRAIMFGNADGVRLLAARGADLNHGKSAVKDGKLEMTPLLYALMTTASREQGPDVVRALLEGGADANAPKMLEGKPYQTPLMAACDHWKSAKKLSEEHPLLKFKPESVVAIILLLLEHGADVNAELPMKSVLGMAVTTDNVEIVRMILDAGARLDGEIGANALMKAAQNPEITKMLRKRGATATARDGTDFLPPELLANLFEPTAEKSKSSGFSLPDFNKMFAEMRAKMDTRRQKRWSGANSETGKKG